MKKINHNLIITFKKWINETPKRKLIFTESKNISIILLSIFFILTIWANKINFYPENVCIWLENSIHGISIIPIFPIKIPGEKIFTENVQINNGCIAALSDNSFSVFSKKGKILQNEKHNFSNPNLKSAGLRYIIFDRGGKNFKISSNTKTLFSSNTEQNILNAAISEKGSYAIVTQSPKYLAELFFYNNHNLIKLQMNFSEYYITNVELNPSASEIALSGISALNGDIISNVYIIDVASKTIKSQFELPDNIITDIKFFTNGNLVAIGDKYSAFINPKTKLVNKKDYENKILKFYDFDKHGSLCLCLSSSSNESSRDTIVKLDDFSKEISKIETDNSFTDIIMNGEKIIGITKNKIISYNMWGACEGYIDSEKFYRKILPAPHQNIFALDSSKISKIRLSGFKSK